MYLNELLFFMLGVLIGVSFIAIFIGINRYMAIRKSGSVRLKYSIIRLSRIKKKRLTKDIAFDILKEYLLDEDWDWYVRYIDDDNPRKVYEAVEKILSEYSKKYENEKRLMKRKQ